MADNIRVIPIACAFQNFHTYAYYVDAPEPAIIDTGVAGSPDKFIVPALEQQGLRIEDVRWVFLTHGHLDHIGGAHAIREATGGRAKVAIHEADAPMLRSLKAIEVSTAKIMDRYAGGRGMDELRAALPDIVSGSFEPDVLLKGDERIDLGGGIVVRALHTPGHSPGSMTYWLEGADWAFTGDAVQLSGGIHTQFPSYESASAYRASLERLTALNPARIHMGHPYKFPGGDIVGPVITDTQPALLSSLSLEARVTAAARRHAAASGPDAALAESPYSPFTAVARELEYDRDPTRFPAPFFITLDGYVKEFAAELQETEG